MVGIPLTLEEQATNYETMEHIRKVQGYLNRLAMDLIRRGEEHDQSKLHPPEVGLFTEHTKSLHGLTYGSPEYKACLDKLKPALDHHYARNRHHPQHFPDVWDDEVVRLKGLLKEAQTSCGEGSAITTYLEEQLKVARSSVGNMNLSDVVEMFCDWKAASLRHDDGNILKSIDINAGRFGLGGQLSRIFRKTADALDQGDEV